MEWSRSNISAEELERSRREYIEAAMTMAKRAASSPETVHNAPPLPAEAPEAAPEAEKIPEAEPQVKPDLQSVTVEEIEEAAEEAEKAAEEVAEEAEEVAEEAEEAAEEAEEAAEKIDSDEKKADYGVFDKKELIEAAARGEVSDEGLKRAAEILAEMSSKTQAMRQILEQSGEKRENKPPEQPQSLSGYIDRHNGGICPRCGQAHDGNRR